MPKFQNHRIVIHPVITPFEGRNRDKSITVNVAQGDYINAEVAVPPGSLHLFVRALLETAGNMLPGDDGRDGAWVPVERSARWATYRQRTLSELLDATESESFDRRNYYCVQFRERGGTMIDGHSNPIGADLELFAEMLMAGFERRQRDLEQMHMTPEEALEASRRLAGAVEKVRLAACLVRQAQDTIVDVFPT